MFKIYRKNAKFPKIPNLQIQKDLEILQHAISAKSVKSSKSSEFIKTTESARSTEIYRNNQKNQEIQKNKQEYAKANEDIKKQNLKNT